MSDMQAAPSSRMKSSPLFSIAINDAAPYLRHSWDFELSTKEKVFLMHSAAVQGSPSTLWRDISPAQQIAIYDAMQRAVIWAESLRQMLFGAQFNAQRAVMPTEAEAVPIDAH